MSSYDGSEKCTPASSALLGGNRATRRWRFGSTLVVAFLGLLSPESAHAEDSASDRATARALAGEGYAALKKKDYATAEDRFLRADQLVHAPTLVLDHGRALVGLGRIGEAYAAFDSIVREVVPPNAPAVWKRAVKDAQRELESLKPQVAWLTLTVKGPAEPVVEVDGRPLPAERLGEKLPETPGSRHIAVSAPGFITQELDEPLKAGEERRLDVDLQPVPEPPPVIVHVPAPMVASTASAPQDRGTGRRTLTYVSFGVAGVGLAVGTATGILWLKARSDIKSACGGLSCAPQSDAEQSRYDDDKRRYDTFGTLSGVGFGVGLVGAASGVLLLLTRPTEPADGEMKQAGVRPYVGPGVLGVYGAFQ